MWCHKVKDQRVRTLGQDCVFRTILISGLLITAGIVSWILIVDWDDLTFICDSYTCMASMIDVLKLPIAILTAAFAVAGFYAVVFRSQQTGIQIQEVINQNNFKNYVDHKKLFMDLLGSIEAQGNVKFSNKDGLYGELFPFNSPLNMCFQSKSVDTEKSSLIFWIEKFNKKSSELDDFFQRSLLNEHRFVSIDLFARWMSEYSCFLLGMHVSFIKTSTVIKGVGDKYFAGRSFLMNVPTDLEQSFVDVEYVLKSLSQFCLLKAPNMAVKRPSYLRSDEVARLIQTITTEVF